MVKILKTILDLLENLHSGVVVPCLKIPLFQFSKKCNRISGLMKQNIVNFMGT